jgi:radical SAM superfamily enzyme
MGNEYLKQSFSLLNKNEYIKYVTTFLLNLDPSIIVARFSGDCPKDFLIASGFSESSNEITKEVTQYFIENNLKQGINRS